MPRVGPRHLGAWLVAAAITGACAGDSGREGSVDDTSVAGPVDGPPDHDDLDPPGTRSLDLSWREECSWLGVDLGASTAPAPELVELHLELLPEHLEELYARNPLDDDRLPGAYRLDGTGPLLHLDDPGIRFRGRSARWLPKKSFNVRFVDDVPGLDARRVNLNAMYTDPSFVREHVAMRMFRAVGVPAPRTEYVDLYLNGSYEGLYLYVQRIDERLLAEQGLASEGVSLVRDRTRQADVDHPSIFSDTALPLRDRERLIETLRERFDTRGVPDWEALADLVVWVHSRDGAPTASEVAEILDLDGLVDWYAPHVLMADVDAFTDDYWLYQHEPGAPWQLLPWDKDLTFGTHFSAEHGGVANDLFQYEWPIFERATTVNAMFEQAFAPPEVRDALVGRIDDLMTDHLDVVYACWEMAAVVPAIAESAERQPDDDAFILHDANHHSEPGNHDLQVARLLDFLQLRTAFLERVLGEVEGEPDTARVTISPDDEGRSVLFTDGRGWTIARMDVLAVEEGGDITVTVAPSDLSHDVDRAWTIESDAGVHGQLSLYYRNTVRFGDWYRQDDSGVEPVGGQHDLTMVEVNDERTAHPSVANPFSNRVTAEVTLDGTTTFVLEEQP